MNPLLGGERCCEGINWYWLNERRECCSALVVLLLLLLLLHVLARRGEGLSDSGRFEHDGHPLLVAAAIVADRQGVVVARLRLLLLLLLKLRRYDLKNFIIFFFK